MNDITNLTEGKIRSTLVKLALPIMGTGFIHMAYNLTDIIWLGRLSTEAVAAAGAAGFYLTGYDLPGWRRSKCSSMLWQR